MFNENSADDFARRRHVELGDVGAIDDVVLAARLYPLLDFLHIADTFYLLGCLLVLEDSRYLDLGDRCLEVLLELFPVNVDLGESL